MSIEEFIEKAKAYYFRNKTWKSRYEGLSDNVKKYMECIFAHGYGSLAEEAKADYAALREDFRNRIVALYKNFTDEEWEEAIARCGNEKGLKMARADYRNRAKS